MKNRNNTFNNAYLIQQKLEKKKKKKGKNGVNVFKNKLINKLKDELIF